MGFVITLWFFEKLLFKITKRLVNLKIKIIFRLYYLLSLKIAFSNSLIIFCLKFLIFVETVAMKTIIFLFSILLYLSCFGQNNKSLLNQSQLSNNELSLMSDDDVKEYIHDIINTPPPSTYHLEQHYFEFSNYSDAVQSLSDKYPEFYGLSGQSLLDVIRRYPDKYKYLVFDTRILRDYYGNNN